MSNRNEESGKQVLVSVLTSKPWLLPILYHVYSLQGAKLNELKELLHLRTQVIKRALWWLTKSGLVEKSGEKYIVSKNYAKYVEELALTLCTTGREYVARIGRTYIVVVIRRARITAYTVPEHVLKKLMNRKLENRSVKDIAAETGMPLRLTARALHLYRILDNCEKP
ncbi:MAG: hypothetical protein ABWW65_01880 [Thermoprotei archaeon]